MRDIHAAERDLQNAGFAAEQRHALVAMDAKLRSLHAGRVALVVSRYADRRTALAHMTDAGARAAASQQIATEEANELARLTVEHAAERRQARKQVLAGFSGRQRSARRNLQQRQRHQKVWMALQLNRFQRATATVHPSHSR